MLDAQITFAIPADTRNWLLEVAASYHAVGMGGRDSFHVLSSCSTQTLSVTVLSPIPPASTTLAWYAQKLGW